MRTTLFLNRRDIIKLITHNEVLSLVETALKEYAQGKAVNPSKLSLPVYPYHEGHINSMPSYLVNEDIAGVKVVSVYSQNPSCHNLPTTLGTIVLNDAETGFPCAVMDGTYITDVRTGAVSGINAKYFARGNSSRLLIIGAGAQGFTSMQMTLLTLPQISRVTVCDLSQKQAHDFIQRAQDIYPHIKFGTTMNGRQAIMDTDITILATSSARPIIAAYDIPLGATVICVSEIITPTTVSKFDSWFVDFTECAIERYNADGAHGSALQGMTWTPLTKDLVSGDIGDVIAGKMHGRVSQEQKILVGAVGMSIEDIMVAHHVFKAAQENGIGLNLELIN